MRGTGVNLPKELLTENIGEVLGGLIVDDNPRGRGRFLIPSDGGQVWKNRRADVVTDP